MLTAKSDGNRNPRDELLQITTNSNKLLRAVGFALQLRVDGSGWHYQGQEVSLADGDTAICWWQTEDPEVYRVIFGDLSAKDVPAEDLPDTL